MTPSPSTPPSSKSSWLTNRCTLSHQLLPRALGTRIPALTADTQICLCAVPHRSPSVAGSRLQQQSLHTKLRNTVVESHSCLGPLWRSPQILFEVCTTEMVVDPRYHLIMLTRSRGSEVWTGCSGTSGASAGSTQKDGNWTGSLSTHTWCWRCSARTFS